MIKEETRFAESTVFEGMTSIRAIIDNLKENKQNARKISKIFAASQFWLIPLKPHYNPNYLMK